MQAFYGCSEGWLTLAVVCGLLTAVASLVAEHGLQGAQGSLVAPHGLSSCGVQGLVRSSWTRAGTCVLCTGWQIPNH